ncbi:cupin domain-containing protein [Streptomyces sp. NPDC015220]|uniref:cupin domain-containing protein n=1 Tax=Streptomyces sp. NPDC015220 TaxID=3364947 RepID=UPI0036FF8891
MTTKFRIDPALAEEEFGMRCQRLVPWDGGDEPPVGAMACFLPAGASSDPDRHSQVEVMFVLGGAGRVELEGESTDVTAGDVVVLPGGLEHVVHNPGAAGAATLSWLSVYWPLHEDPREVAA